MNQFTSSKTMEMLKEKTQDTRRANPLSLAGGKKDGRREAKLCKVGSIPSSLSSLAPQGTHSNPLLVGGPTSGLRLHHVPEHYFFNKRSAQGIDS